MDEVNNISLWGATMSYGWPSELLNLQSWRRCLSHKFDTVFVYVCSWDLFYTRQLNANYETCILVMMHQEASSWLVGNWVIGIGLNISRIQSLPNHVAVDLASHPAIDSFLTDQTLTPHWKVTPKKIHPKIALYFSLVIILWVPGAKKKSMDQNKHLVLPTAYVGRGPGLTFASFPQEQRFESRGSVPTLRRASGGSLGGVCLAPSQLGGCGVCCQVVSTPGRLEKVGLYRILFQKNIKDGNPQEKWPKKMSIVEFWSWLGWFRFKLPRMVVSKSWADS